MDNNEGSVTVVQLDRSAHSLFPGDARAEGMMKVLLAKGTEPEGGESKQGVSLGQKAHPFNMRAVIDFQTSNEHHSTCIHTKVSSSVGLGHVTEQARLKRDIKSNPYNADGTPRVIPSDALAVSRVDQLLNPLCTTTWQETLSDVAEDFWQAGNGYLEVVRRGDGGEITGLHHIPAPDVHVFIEDVMFNKHYLIQGDTQFDGSVIRRFACFGDRQDFLRRASQSGGVGAISFEVPARGADNDPNSVSEIIHFRRPTSISRWYGFPDWVSATASIELVQMIMQHNFDFFLNRGVPEFLALFLGQKLEREDWQKIENGLKATVGLGNSHKSIAANLAVDSDFRVQIEKLSMEETNDGNKFSDIRDNLALSIVSAHRVPPLLAGIQIPGKLGATNELPNALMAFQILVIGPVQRLFQQTLGQTLGGDNGVPGLTVEDFEFVKITEEIDVGTMDTVARMRQTPMQASNEGRDLNRGVRE